MDNSWFSNESFWQELYPFMFDVKRLARTTNEVSGIIHILDLQADDRIIDFGCGNGRHLLELARRGYTHSTGIDSTAYYIDIAKENAAKEHLSPEFKVKDMLTSPDQHEFTVALSLFSSFGYYNDHQDNMQVLKNMYDSLKGGGKVLIDVRGKENFAHNFDAQSWSRSSDSLILTERSVLDDFSRIENNWIVIRDGKERSYSFTHWIYSARELKEMLSATSFKHVKVYGDFSAEAYTPESKRLVVVATK